MEIVFEGIETKHYKLKKWSKTTSGYYLVFMRKERWRRAAIYINVWERADGHSASIYANRETKHIKAETEKIKNRLQQFFMYEHGTRIQYVLGSKWEDSIVCRSSFRKWIEETKTWIAFILFVGILGYLLHNILYASLIVSVMLVVYASFAYVSKDDIKSVEKAQVRILFGGYMAIGTVLLIFLKEMLHLW